jgi:FtsP/CotA-like multicopper oxidase with cupredoxin domain
VWIGRGCRDTVHAGCDRVLILKDTRLAVDGRPIAAGSALSVFHCYMPEHKDGGMMAGIRRAAPRIM